MDQETLKLRRLFAQYLLAPDSRLHVVRAMDGFQAQFLSNAITPCACEARILTRVMPRTDW